MGSVSVPDLSNRPRYRAVRANNYTADCIALYRVWAIPSPAGLSQINRTDETTVDSDVHRDLSPFVCTPVSSISIGSFVARRTRRRRCYLFRPASGVAIYYKDRELSSSPSPTRSVTCYFGARFNQTHISRVPLSCHESEAARQPVSTCSKAARLSFLRIAARREGMHRTDFSRSANVAVVVVVVVGGGAFNGTSQIGEPSARALVVTFGPTRNFAAWFTRLSNR